LHKRGSGVKRAPDDGHDFGNVGVTGIIGNQALDSTGGSDLLCASSEMQMTETYPFSISSFARFTDRERVAKPAFKSAITKMARIDEPESLGIKLWIIDLAELRFFEKMNVFKREFAWTVCVKIQRLD
jgi:hypothetical protein